MVKSRFQTFITLGLLAAGPPLLADQLPLVVSPSTFDFGWCPDNAKINATFTIKNTGAEMIPITSVQPTCGCTASQFTPGELASNEETNVGLTFNTRGYAGTKFNKSTKIKTDAGGAEYTVMLTGHVVDTSAKVVPEGAGIVNFEPGKKEKKKTIRIQNKSDKDVSLNVVQKQADWAKVKLKSETIKAGQSIAMDVNVVNGSVDEVRDTSITFSTNDGTDESRFTIAIRTGQALPAPSAKPGTPAPAPPPVPSP